MENNATKKRINRNFEISKIEGKSNHYHMLIVNGQRGGNETTESILKYHRQRQAKSMQKQSEITR